MVIGGGGIFLIALGAILTFAVTDQTVGPLNLAMVGWILMLAGVAALVMSVYAWNSRRHVTEAPPSQANYSSRAYDDGTVEERRIRRNY